MARTVLAVQTVDAAAGLVPAYTAANVDGHSVDPAAILHVKNGSASPITVTVVSGGTAGGLAIADRPHTVANAGERMIAIQGGPVMAQADGTIWVDFSAVASVTVAAVTLP